MDQNDNEIMRKPDSYYVYDWCTNLTKIKLLKLNK